MAKKPSKNNGKIPPPSYKPKGDWSGKPAQRTELELRKLALGYVNGQIFGSWQIPKREESIMMSVFMPLIFLEEEHKQEMLDRGVEHIYEDMSKRGPMCINGYPIFFSFRCLTGAEFGIFSGYVDDLIKRQNEFLGTTDDVVSNSDSMQQTTEVSEGNCSGVMGEVSSSIKKLLDPKDNKSGGKSDG